VTTHIFLSFCFSSRGGFHQQCTTNAWICTNHHAAAHLPRPQSLSSSSSSNSFQELYSIVLAGLYTRSLCTLILRNPSLLKSLPLQTDQISSNDRQTIKNSIVDLMVTVPPAVQRQLSEALSIISESDFPSKWENLLPVRLNHLLRHNFNF